MIRRCHICHGKGKRTVITRMTFGPDSEIDTKLIDCEMCEGDGNLFIVPASKAPKPREDV